MEAGQDAQDDGGAEYAGFTLLHGATDPTGQGQPPISSHAPAPWHTWSPIPSVPAAPALSSGPASHQQGHWSANDSGNPTQPAFGNSAMNSFGPGVPGHQQGGLSMNFDMLPTQFTPEELMDLDLTPLEEPLDQPMGMGALSTPPPFDQAVGMNMMPMQTQFGQLDGNPFGQNPVNQFGQPTVNPFGQPHVSSFGQHPVNPSFAQHPVSNFGQPLANNPGFSTAYQPMQGFAGGNGSEALLPAQQVGQFAVPMQNPFGHLDNSSSSIIDNNNNNMSTPYFGHLGSVDPSLVLPSNGGATGINVAPRPQPDRVAALRGLAQPQLPGGNPRIPHQQTGGGAGARRRRRELALGAPAGGSGASGHVQHRGKIRS